LTDGFSSAARKTSNSAAQSMQNVLELEGHFELPILQCIIL
jgi:hypothetical protein